MSPAPRVTVGVPVYNGGRYLAEALDSVAAQTYGDFEVIVLDNASDDATPDIARAYAQRDPRFRYQRHRENIGPVANYNALVHLAAAPLFRWLAADDALRPDYLERCVGVLDADPEVVLATSALELFGADGRPLASDGTGRYRVATDGERVLDRPSIAALLDQDDPPERFGHVLHGMFGIQISTYMYGVVRTEVLRRTGLEGAYPGGDKVLLAELALHGRFREISDVLWRCRIHPQHLGALPPATLERRLRPGRTVRFSTMRVDQLRGYAAAIRRAPLGAGERRRCIALLIGRGRAAGRTM